MLTELSTRATDGEGGKLLWNSPEVRNLHHEKVRSLTRIEMHCDTWLWSTKRGGSLNGEHRL